MYLAIFFLTFAVTVTFGKFLPSLAVKFQLIDEPVGGRKIHKKPIPLIGGLVIYTSFFVVLLSLFFLTSVFDQSTLHTKHILGICIASTIIILGGILDDRYDLDAKWQIIPSFLGAAIVIVSGIGITSIGNPFGEALRLDSYVIDIVKTDTLHWKFTVFSDIFTLMWLMLMMYTTKIMDGLDGLVTGITGIGALGIFALSLTAIVNQPDTAIIAIILAGACFGFLKYNFYPASSFLGTSGSLLTGFLLGVLAIISGAKVATTLFIMGIPVVDLIWVVFQRKFIQRTSIAAADKSHLHFRLLDLGYSHRNAVLFLYALVSLFAVSAVFLQNIHKFYALILGIVLASFISVFVYKKTSIEK